jgi:hypothetical protein
LVKKSATFPPALNAAMSTTADNGAIGKKRNHPMRATTDAAAAGPSASNTARVIEIPKKPAIAQRTRWKTVKATNAVRRMCRLTPRISDAPMP